MQTQNVDNTNLNNGNYYRLRSRNVVIQTPKRYKDVRVTKKRSIHQISKSDKKCCCSKEADPDSGYADDFEDSFDDNNNIPSYAEKRQKIDWKRALNEVEKCRDTGLFIQCCNKDCNKYRYCEEYHDPVDVPELWYCQDLNDGTTCQTPEKEIPPAIVEDLIENVYTAGSLVWARYPGYPWWPGMVCDSPDTLTYYKLKPRSTVEVMKYHVVYFSNKGSIERSWLALSNLKPFTKTPRSSLNKKMIYHGRDYTAEVDVAYKIASAILRNNLTISERLAGYSFLSFYGGFSPSTVASLKSLRSVGSILSNNHWHSPNSDEDFIPGTPQASTKHKKYLRKISRKLFNKN